jgi:predicted enzyme related to lactoylglutathione lyase
MIEQGKNIDMQSSLADGEFEAVVGENVAPSGVELSNNVSNQAVQSVGPRLGEEQRVRVVSAGQTRSKYGKFYNQVIVEDLQSAKRFPIALFGTNKEVWEKKMEKQLGVSWSDDWAGVVEGATTLACFEKPEGSRYYNLTAIDFEMSFAASAAQKGDSYAD